MSESQKFFYISAGLAAAAAIILAAVWIIELAGVAPCPLCLQQRFIYYLCAPLAAIAAAFSYGQKPTANIRAILFVIAFLFLLNSIFGGWHSGVEYGWWAGPQGCSGADSIYGGLPSTTQDLLAQLNNPIVSCSTPAIKFLSLSLATYNMLGAAALSALAFYGFINNEE